MLIHQQNANLRIFLRVASPRTLKLETVIVMYCVYPQNAAKAALWIVEVLSQMLKLFESSDFNLVIRFLHSLLIFLLLHLTNEALDIRKVLFYQQLALPTFAMCKHHERPNVSLTSRAHGD